MPGMSRGSSVTFEPLTPDRRRAMTRQHLLDAAAIVFARNGFHGSTLDEVAATAGFSKGAVYSNFKSKDDLFLELLHDRVDRQFAVISEALETDPDDDPDQFPRIRQILHSNTSPWDDDFVTLWLEFTLYARRNPDAQQKLAASQRRARAQVQALIDHEYETRGVMPKYPTQDLAEIGMALFSGLGIDRLVDPTAITDETIDTTLAFLFDAMGVHSDPTQDSALE
jgi:AcrR family transcriptional regulator